MKNNKTVVEKLIEEKNKFMLRYLQAMEVYDARLAEDYDVAFDKKITEAIEAAKLEGAEEERERFIGFLKENHKGAFRDDGGNDCWYVEDLVEALNPPKQP